MGSNDLHVVWFWDIGESTILDASTGGGGK